MKRVLKPILATLLAISLLFGPAASFAPTQVVFAKDGITNLSYTFTNLDGQTVSTENTGKSLKLLVFGKTTSTDCQTTVRNIAESSWSTGSDAECVFIDIGNASASALKSFSSEYGKGRLRVCADSGSQTNNLAMWDYYRTYNEYALGGNAKLPVCVFIDKNNCIRNVTTSAQKKYELNIAIQTFVSLGSGSNSSDLASHEQDFIKDVTDDFDPSSYNTVPDKQKKLENLAEISAQAKSIVSGKNTDEEKLKAIHDWVATNIAYDMESYNANDIMAAADPVHVFKTKRAVCAGYSQIMRLMLTSVGVPCLCVIGYGAGLGTSGSISVGTDLSESNHEWNLVFVDGSWKIVDATWDSQNAYYGPGDYRNKSGQAPTRKYYEISPTEFSKDHYSMYVSTYDYNDNDSKSDAFISVSRTQISSKKNTWRLTFVKTPNEWMRLKTHESSDGSTIIAVKKGAFKKCKNLQHITIVANDEALYKKLVKQIKKSGLKNVTFTYECDN